MFNMFVLLFCVCVFVFIVIMLTQYSSLPSIDVNGASSDLSTV